MTPPISPATYKDIILNARQPIVLRQVPLRWRCLDAAQLPIEAWAAHFDADARYASAGVTFHFGPCTGGRQPQWERCHTSGKMRVAEFLREYNTKPGNEAPSRWASFSYKNLRDMPAECWHDIGFDALGIERSVDDFTFWLGSRAAHTPCHYDTYGCNVVVQVYGHKTWVLLPPTAHLTARRVPYEESSVYCAENFYSPDGSATAARFACIEQDVHHVRLQPGDVLVVPPKWWHYAENVDISLSVNSWIPLESDLDAHMEECIVRATVTEYTRHLDRRQRAALINPNELANMYDTTLSDQLQLLAHIAKYLRSEEARQTWPVASFKPNYLTVDEALTLINSLPESHGFAVRRMPVAEFRELLALNAKRYCGDAEDDGASDETIKHCADFINATCSPESVERVKRSMLRTV